MGSQERIAGSNLLDYLRVISLNRDPSSAGQVIIARGCSASVLSPSNVSKISESIRELGLVVVQQVS